MFFLLIIILYVFQYINNKISLSGLVCFHNSW